MSHKWANHAAAYIISSLIILIILISSVLSVAFDIDFFEKQYVRLGISEDTGMDYKDLVRVTADLLDYIRGERKELESVKAEINGEFRQVFNEVEIAHMVDVKNLFDFCISLRDISSLLTILLSLILFISLKYFKAIIKLLSKAYLKVFLSVICFFLFILLLMNINFTASWDYFHYIFFNNDLWQLDPETDIMINMMPEEFFMSAVYRVLVYTAACMGVFALIAYLIVRRDKKTVPRKDEGDKDELLQTNAR